MTFRRHSVCFLIALLTILVPASVAQTADTAALTGTVTDPTGAVVSSATVTLTNSETNQSRTANTGTDGTYKFALIPPGRYRVRFNAAGFKIAEVGPVTLNVTETPVLNETLEVGQQSEQVTVEATAELLQTSDSTLGRVVDAATLSNQPLATRNFTS